MGWIMIFFGVVSGASSVYLNMQEWYKISSSKTTPNVILAILTLWLIPHGYYILSHKNSFKTKKEPFKQSTGISISGEHNKVEGNITKGFDKAIDVSGKDNIIKDNLSDK